jgi:hypothetical protein
MSMLSNLDLIRRVPLVLDADERPGTRVADSVVKRRFRRGEIVVEQGRRAMRCSSCSTAAPACSTSDSRGREVILAVLKPATTSAR